MILINRKGFIDFLQFKDIFCALRFCTVYEEIRQFFRMKNKTRAEKRRLFVFRTRVFNALAAEVA